MAYVVVHCVYKSWVNTMRWTTLSYDQLLTNFASGNRQDVLGKWPTLCDIGPVTKVSRDVTDQEVLSTPEVLEILLILQGHIYFGNSEPITTGSI